MPLTDCYGYELTLSAPAASAPWTGATAAFLAHGSAMPSLIARTLEMAPDFALGHAVHGLCRLLLARRELVAVAEVDWRTADAARRAVPITARENAVVDALRDWLDGFPARAAHRLDTALRAHPSDAVLMKLVHSIRFLLGDAPGMRCSIEAVLGAFDDTHPAFGYLQGCYAFALEETGDYAAAERTGRRALEITPDDVWGLHAVAHVLDMTGRSDEGRAWLEERTEAWSHCNNFRYHVWWHLALMYLDRGDIGKVLALYDQEIRADHSDDFRDVANGASLLMRLELEGVNVGGRWEELARIAETRIDDACNVFADLHYLLSLNGGERRRAAETLVASLAARGAAANAAADDMAPVAEIVGASAAAGLEAHHKGNFYSAFHQLERARPCIHQIGGSHAQRDVFERIAIDAALRAGLANEAERLLNARLSLRGAADRFATERLAIAKRMQRAANVMQAERLRAVPA